MSCDVTERNSPALSQISRGQRGRRERLGTRKEKVPSSLPSFPLSEFALLSNLNARNRLPSGHYSAHVILQPRGTQRQFFLKGVEKTF